MSHNANCSDAKGHVCRCGGCGGSQHGWQAWVGLAKEPPSARHGRRQAIGKQWAKHYRPPRRRSNRDSKAACTDAVRLDLADWLARQAVTTHLANTANTAPPSAETDPDSHGTSGEPGPQAGAPIPDGPEASGGEPGRPVGEAAVRTPAAVEQVEAFAKAMTEDIWNDIVAELGDDPERLRAVRLQLADHGWCDLFIGFVMVIEKFGEVLDKIPESAKILVTKAILASSKQDKRPQLTSVVVGMVVDKAWSAFKNAAFSQMPLLGVLTNDDVLRSLRMLALFICPSPENHPEIREHAIKPLGDDACEYVTDQTKEWLATQFKEWTAGAWPWHRDLAPVRHR